jgi:uncharacterized membrane protein
MPKRGLALVRVGVSALAAVAVLAVSLATGAAWGIALTASWSAAAVVYLAWVWLSLGRMDADAARSHAREEDGSRAAADIVLLAASIASLAGVGAALVYAGNHTAEEALTIGLGVLGVALGWATVHTVFALRYGALYYGDPVGGIDFDEPPDYRDFAYVAFTIGMTFQVSDTAVHATRVRRNVLRHAFLSYVFGTVIIAVTINLVASLLKP